MDGLGSRAFPGGAGRPRYCGLGTAGLGTAGLGVAGVGVAGVGSLVGLGWLVLVVSGVPGWTPAAIAGPLDHIPGVALSGA
jgi:hypothetical protein